MFKIAILLAYLCIGSCIFAEQELSPLVSVKDPESVIAIYHGWNENERVWLGIAAKLAADIARLFPNKKVIQQKVYSWKCLPDKNADKEIAIIVGPNIIQPISDNASKEDRTIIVLNTEQPEALVNDKFFGEWCKLAFQVWDYSCITEGQWGNKRRVIPFAQYPKVKNKANLEEINPHVLFVGTWCPRRQALQESLQSAGISNNFHFAGSLWGQDLDKAVDDAAVVFNWHYYTKEPILETERITYLASRGKCIISERSNDKKLDANFEDSLIFIDSTLEGNIKEAVETAQRLLSNKAEREYYEQKALELAHKLAKQRDAALLAALDF